MNWQQASSWQPFARNAERNIIPHRRIVQIVCRAIWNGSRLVPEGALVTFTKIHVPPEHFAVRQPLMPFSSIQFEPCPIGILEVEGGLKIMGWIPKVDIKKIKVGMKMKASPFTLPDGKLTIVWNRFK